MGDALRLAPQNEDLRLELIENLQPRRQHEKAAEHYEQLVSINPTNPDYFVGWGNELLSDNSVERGKRVQAASRVWKRLAVARADDPVITAKVPIC